MSGYRPLLGGGGSGVDARSWWPKPIAGLMLPMAVGENQNTTGAADILMLYFVPCPHAVTLTGMAINVMTAAAGATPRLGLYAVGADGLPGALLVDAGTVDASTTGVKAVSFAAVSITTGAFYAALAWQGTLGSLALRGYTTDVGPVPPMTPEQLLSAAPGHRIVTGVSGALPNPAGTTATTGSLRMPAIAITVGSLL